MKTLTKEDLPIGTKVVPHGKTRGMPFKECDAWNTNEARKQGFLYVARNDKDGYLVLNEYYNETYGSHYNYSDVTLFNEHTKIKKSELLNRIEALEKKVAELEEIAKVTIEAEADKPQFEIGKVYKLHDTKIMFYCTDANLDVYGFGFDKNGRWTEKSFFSSSNITEATPEEWFERLEEYAKDKYPKGCKVGCLHGQPYNEIDTHIFEGFKTNLAYLRHKNSNDYVCCVMDNGKWVDIIEEPQRMTVEQRDELAKPFNPDEYQIGTIGIFWDGDFDEKMRRGRVLFGELDHITENVYFRRKGASWSYYNFKPIKIY